MQAIDLPHEVFGEVHLTAMAEGLDRLAGATVELLGTGLITTTGADGSFEIHEVPPGEYTVRVSATGYAATDKARVVAAPTTHLEIALVPVSIRRVTVLEPE